MDVVGSWVAVLALIVASRFYTLVRPCTYAGAPFTFPPAHLLFGSSRAWRTDMTVEEDGRIRPVFAHRLQFIRGEVRDGRELRCDILGQGGTVYEVVISDRISCTCNDFIYARDAGQHCKHLLFVKIFVLRMTRATGLFVQRHYLPFELDYMLSHLPAVGVSDPTRNANAAVRAGVAGVQPQPRLSDDRCAICMDDLGVETVYCRAQCGTRFDRGCIEQLKAHQPDPRCPLCRQPWLREDAAVVVDERGRQNMAAFAPVAKRKRAGSRGR